MARAKGMGAGYALFVDVDEFAFPSPVSLRTLEAAFLQQKDARALLLSSMIFHTTICGRHARTQKTPKSYHDFLYTFVLAQPDESRPKVAIKVGDMTAAEVARVDLLIHTIVAGATLVDATYAHIHHYREAFHPLVCSKVLGEPVPEGWSVHKDEVLVLAPVNEVWMDAA